MHINEVPTNCVLYHGTRRLETSTLSCLKIEALLENNNFLDSSETSESRVFVQAGLKDLIDLDEEITLAKAHLDHLEAERGIIQKIVNMHKTVLQSSRRLDVDVLSQIICMACDADQSLDDENAHSLDVRRTQWRLGQVSALWRDIVVNQMPLVWTNIKLRIVPELGSLNYLLDRLMRRTAGLELNVHLYISEDHDPASPAQRLLTQFLPSSDRWHSFHIESWFKVIEKSSMDWEILDGNLPILRHFSYEMHRRDPITRVPALSNAIRTATTIESMTSWGLCFPNQLWPLKANIRKFTWFSASLKQGKGYYGIHLPLILSRLKDLEVCEVDVVFSDTVTSAIHSIRLSRLRKLVLHGIIFNIELQASKTAVSGGIEHLLAMLEAPSLTSLVITGKLWDITPLIDCLQRSGCSLRNLEIPFVNSDNVYGVLLNTPHLRHLTISFPGTIDFTFLSRLTTGTESGICLYLEQISILWREEGLSWLGRKDLEILMRMVKSRNAEIIGMGPNGSIRASSQDTHLFTTVLRDCMSEKLGIEKRLTFICIP